MEADLSRRHAGRLAQVRPRRVDDVDVVFFAAWGVIERDSVSQV